MTRSKKKSLGIHLILFVAVHAVLYVVIRSDISSPDWLLLFQEAARSGKTGIYHASTGIYVNGFWALIFVIDASYSLWVREDKRSTGKEETEPVTASNKAGGLQPAVRGLKSGSLPSAAGRRHNPWVFLILGGLLEIVWAVLLKMNLLGGPLLLIFYFSFYCLARAAKTLPISTVAAVFAGIGAAGTVMLDMLFFDREIHWIRLGLATLLIVFMVLLKIGSENKREAS